MTSKESFLTQGSLTGSKVLSSDGFRDSTLKSPAFSSPPYLSVDASKVDWEEMETLHDKYSVCSSTLIDLDDFEIFTESSPSNLDSMAMDCLDEDNGTESEKSKLISSKCLDAFNKLEDNMLELKDNYTSKNSQVVDISNSDFNLENVSTFFDSHVSTIKDFGKGNFEEEMEQTTISQESSKESSDKFEDCKKKENISTNYQIVDKSNSDFDLENVSNFFDSDVAIIKQFGKENFGQDIEQTTQSKESSKESSNKIEDCNKKEITLKSSKILADKTNLIVIDANAFPEAIIVIERLDSSVINSYLNKAALTKVPNEKIIGKSKLAKDTTVKMQTKIRRSTKKAEEGETKLTSAIKKAKDKLTKFAKMRAALIKFTKKTEESLTELTNAILKAKDKRTKLARAAHKRKKRAY